MSQLGLWMSLPWARWRRTDAEAGEQAAHDRGDALLREAAHTMRTPIAVARSHAELVLDGLEEGSPEHEDTLVVLDELDRAARLADQLLLLGTATAPDALVREPVELTALALEVARRWSTASGREIAVEADGPVPVLADASRLRDALDALVENALRACRHEDRIAICAWADAGGAVLAVADDGPGIARDDRERIFERFARGAAASSRGTGLGLAIVRAIAEGHGGALTLDSELGRGSTFSLALGPVLRTDPRPAPAAVRSPEPAPQAA